MTAPGGRPGGEPGGEGRTTGEIVARLRKLHAFRAANPISGFNIVVSLDCVMEAADRLEALDAAALHACDTPDCPAITYRCAESRTA